MYPFPGGLLSGLSNRLALNMGTGIITNVTEHPNPAYAGVYLRTTGRLQRRQGSSTFTNYSDSWINEDFWDMVDSSLYEARITGLTGDTAELVGSAAEDTWISLASDRFWEISAGVGNDSGDPSENFSVEFTLEVREIANTDNLVSHAVDLTVIWTGGEL
jgi:hypothetical protein